MSANLASPSNLAGPPNFGDLHAYASLWNGSWFTSVASVSRGTGFRYGLGLFNVRCDDREYDILIAMLPSTELSEVDVRWQIDDGDVETESWQVSHVYEVSTGHEAGSPNPAALYHQLRDAERFTIEVPQLNVGPAHVDLEALLSSPIQENLDRCEDSDYEPTEEEYPKHEHAIDLHGKHGESIEYSAEELSPGSVLTSVRQTAVLPADDDRHFQLEIECNPSGAISASLRFPADWGLSGVAPVDVSVRVDAVPPRTEEWYSYWLPDSFQLRSESAAVLVLALARSETLWITIPDLEIHSAQFDLPPMFSTPVQENLNHCGY